MRCDCFKLFLESFLTSQVSNQSLTGTIHQRGLAAVTIRSSFSVHFAILSLFSPRRETTISLPFLYFSGGQKLKLQIVDNGGTVLFNSTNSVYERFDAYVTPLLALLNDSATTPSSRRDATK